MLKSKSLLYLLLVLAWIAGPVAARGSAATSTATSYAFAGGDMSSQMLKSILTKAIAEWPEPNNYNYGTFRSAYNHGTLTIEDAEYVTNGYNVAYGGIVVCVILPA